MSLPDLISPPLPPALLVPLDRAKALLGVPAGDVTHDEQITFGLEIATGLVVEYTGRRLVRDSYSDRYQPPYGFSALFRDGLYLRRFATSEFPIISVEAVESEPAGGAVPLWVTSVQAAQGILTLNGQGVGPDAIRIDYTAGYDPLPADLTAVVLELTRRQLLGMGVDLAATGGSPTAAGAAPVKAVTVGALRVEYAIAGAPAGAFDRAGASPVIGATMELYASTLGHYIHPRKIAGTWP